ncbi:protein kinase [Sulfurisphaera javensis]|uniref:non-specific serine/threonine protein kinase n=1 Tax=Sulfurisphaera javensis TaxID=2049879 RepID=A0AAT9GQ80_9CREN
MQKIKNKKLFYSSIANIILILIFSLNFKNSLFGLISVPFTILSSIDKKYVKIALVTSFLSSVLEFPTPFYPLSILLSIVTLTNLFAGVLIIGITDISVLLVFLAYKITNTPLNDYLLLPLSATSAFLGFLCIRALKGLDYDIITFNIHGLPNGETWYLTFNSKTFQVKENHVEVIADKGTWIICPIQKANMYFIPDNHVGEAKGGDIINVKFSTTYTIDLRKYPECTILFVGKNIPTDFLIKINGKKYKGKEIIVLPETQSVNWIAEDLIIGDLLFEPKVKSGIALRGQYVEIEYEPKLLRKSLDVFNWDPKSWINEKIYGYRVLEVVGEGGGSYVLKGEKEGKYYAIKVLKIEPSKSQTKAISDFIDLFKESNNLIELSNNEGLVKLYGIFIDINQIGSIMRGDSETYLKYPPSIVMEFMEGGTLKDLMKFYKTDREWYELVKIILTRISLALRHIHNSGYVHLDIKPQNVFFSEKLPDNLSNILSILFLKPQIIKLGDLGSSSKIGGKITQITPEYSSPKQLENAILGLGATIDMDIFSLGMIGYYLLTGKTSPISTLLDEALNLYNNNNIRNSLLKVDEAKKFLSTWNIDFPPNAPQSLKQLIEDCIKGKINNSDEFFNRLNLIVI